MKKRRLGGGGPKKRYKALQVKRRTQASECQVCGNEKEDLPHFILWSPAYEEPRKKNKILQQPYEDQEEIIGNFLFEENIREAKETLYQFWKIREKMH